MRRPTHSRDPDDLRSPARRRLLRQAGQLAIAGGLLAGGGWAVLKRRQNLWQVRRERTLMQTSVSVTCLSDDVQAAGEAIDAAFARMAATAAELTRFDPASPLARLNRDGRLALVPANLHAVLREALSLSALTGGAFDPTVLPVLRYFETLRGASRTDAHEQRVAEDRDALVGYRDLVLDARGVRLLRPGMAVTLDGIAKGHVVDQGIAALRAAGIEYALIDAGGDIHAISGNDPGRHWNVGIVDPRDTSRVAAVLQLRNAALSTSGNYRVFFSSDRRLFHIVNPRTGWSPQGYSSVTVMAQRSVLADGMSTAAFSLERPQLSSLMDAQDHQWLAFSRDGERRWRSRELPLIAGAAELA